MAKFLFLKIIISQWLNFECVWLYLKCRLLLLLLANCTVIGILWIVLARETLKCGFKFSRVQRVIQNSNEKYTHKYITRVLKNAKKLCYLGLGCDSIISIPHLITNFIFDECVFKSFVLFFEIIFHLLYVNYKTNDKEPQQFIIEL